ncbi:MAG: leucine-rich repeat domain-containing protein [Candidatus Odinarchaeota archaeon]
MTNDNEIIKKIEEELGLSLETRVKYEENNAVDLNLGSIERAHIPYIIGELKSLKKLNISSSAFESLPESIGNLKNLREIIALDTYKLKSLSDSFGELISLEELLIQHTELASLPENFGNLRNLKSATLSNNKLNVLPNSFGNLENLALLELWGNELTTLPESFGNLRNLKRLTLKRNQLKYLPDNFGTLENLETIELNLNSLLSVPEAFGNLKNLKRLDVSDNQILYLPESIGNLQNLVQLIIKRNKLTTLPNSFGKLENLKEVYLDENQLSSLPDIIGDLNKLESLYLPNNNLKSLPETLKNMEKLKKLNIDSNDINPIPEFLAEIKTLQNLTYANKDLEFYRANLDTIKKIRANKVRITGVPFMFWFYLMDIPESLIKVLPQISSRAKPMIRKGEMPEQDGFWVLVEENQIIGISATGQFITQLPEDLGLFKDLKYLILNNNSITTLPNSIGNCIKLEEVNLSNNQITELPESFSNLTAIKNLNLSNNKLNNIPTELWALKELAELNLTNNPFEPEEITISQKVPDLILKYLRKKATIRVFISHAVIDFEPYQIGPLVEFLEKQKEISEVFFCEENLAGNIDEWMLDTVQKCQLVLFIATKKSVFDSVDCTNELQLADKFSIPVIPLKGIDVEWSDLAERNLSRELGLEYDTENFDTFCEDVYKYIENFKREIDLMDKKEREKSITDIYERFRLILDERLDNIIRKIDNLGERISKVENRNHQ